MLLFVQVVLVVMSELMTTWAVSPSVERIRQVIVSKCFFIRAEIDEEIDFKKDVQRSESPFQNRTQN